MALALEQVCTVHRGGMDTDKNFVGPGYRLRDLLDLEDLWPAGARDNGCEHQRVWH